MSTGGLKDSIYNFCIHVLTVLLRICTLVIIAFYFDVLILPQAVCIKSFSDSILISSWLFIYYLLLLDVSEELSCDLALSTQLLLPTCATILILWGMLDCLYGILVR